jgi:Transposase DNA-binding/Transposase Tn5 dimerisation domain
MNLPKTAWSIIVGEGIAEELQGIDLGDKRLDKRSRRIIETLAANPEASINASCEGWSETLAVYRFFDNDAVTPEQILRPHREATQRRMREQAVVLIVQDTTELDYSDHPPKDARCLNEETRFGLYEHAVLAVTPDKLCLGVVGGESFGRAAESLGQTHQRRTLPIEAKESFRWLKGYRLACQLAAECPTTQIVSVADRESDIYDIFVEAREQPGRRAEYIIRAQEDRCTLEPDPESGPMTYHKVRAEVGRSKLRTTKTIELCQTPKRAARQARLELRAISVQVKPPQARKHLLPVTHQVVLVEEVGGPGDGTDLSWLLITTLPIDTLDEVSTILEYYLARWAVEIYFRTLKTGCRVEEIQLETIGRLQRCLAFYRIIAWRILYLTYLNRTCPKLPCTAVFEESEWKSVWRVVTKKALPKKPPMLSKFMQLLTQLGGYNNRATELPAGPLPLWIGLRRMTDFATAWLAFGPESKKLVYK